MDLTFIEYKINQKFNFTDLLKDFLKFLIYSYKLKSKVTFIYILFMFKKTNEDDFFEIYVNEDEEKRLFKLTKNLKNSDELSSSNFFIFENKINFFESPDIRTNFINESLKFLKNIDKKEIDYNKEIKFKTNLFYKNRNKFSTNVLTSKNITDSFIQINKIYEKIKNKNFFENIEKKYLADLDFKEYYIFEDAKDDDILKIEDFISFFHDCKNEIFKKKIKEDDIGYTEGNNSMFTQSKNISLWIIMLIDIFWKEVSKKFKNNEINFKVIKKAEKNVWFQEFLNSTEKWKNNNYDKFNKLTINLIIIINGIFLNKGLIKDGIYTESEDFLEYKTRKDILDSLESLKSYIPNIKESNKIIKKIDDISEDVLIGLMNSSK
ncbi:hypothetical protein [Mesoplasma florum]|uniref:hypothetical protein n=1 Tax=Mesoplasma florum TaxID=2151 RepID=UPI000BE3352B|nr:hypothetical protein [Mesoplasma florum]ATI73974.1 hypothetical protein CQZ70_01765 [Mesoplasma florum]